MGQLRAAIYCRVSTSDQSCDRQRRDLVEYAARADYQIVGVFQEKASGALCDRSERNKVMELVRGRQVDVVLCTELSRWGRSIKDVVLTVDELSGRNVSLVCQKDFNGDLTTAHGKFILSVVAAFAELERNLNHDRVCSGLAAAKARGQQLGRPRGPSPQTVRKRAAVLSLHQQGYSLRAIASQLKMSKNTVHRLVKRSSSAKAT